MSEIAVIPAEQLEQRAAEVERQVADARAQAEAIQVRNAEEADLAGAALRQINERRKAAEAERVALVKPLNDHVKEINRKFKDAAAPFDEADRIIRGKVQTYTEEQERIRQEEEARLERERQERERKAREAREKQEAEERAKREQAEREAREAAEEAQRAKDAADREAAEQLAAEAKQKAEEAQTAESAIASLPEVSLPTAMVPSAPKPEGISTRKRWVVKAIDVGALPAEYLIADEKAINAAMRDGVRKTGAPPEIPGVVFEQKSELAVRA